MNLCKCFELWRRQHVMFGNVIRSSFRSKKQSATAEETCHGWHFYPSSKAKQAKPVMSNDVRNSSSLKSRYSHTCWFNRLIHLLYQFWCAKMASKVPYRLRVSTSAMKSNQNVSKRQNDVVTHAIRRNEVELTGQLTPRNIAKIWRTSNRNICGIKKSSEVLKDVPRTRYISSKRSTEVYSASAKRWRAATISASALSTVVQ